MTPEPAEHTRFHGYVHALSQVSDADECDLLAVVFDDPDRAMADSAVIGHPDRRGAAPGVGETFADWSLRIARVLEGHDLPERRLGAWSLLREIDSGQSWNTADARGHHGCAAGPAAQRIRDGTGRRPDTALAAGTIVGAWPDGASPDRPCPKSCCSTR